MGHPVRSSHSCCNRGCIASSSVVAHYGGGQACRPAPCLPSPIIQPAMMRQQPILQSPLCAAPNVLIWSAVACSSAFPFLFAPQDLLAKDACGNFVRFSETGAAQSQRRWCDGSLEEDLPMRGLRQAALCSCLIWPCCGSCP